MTKTGNAYDNTLQAEGALRGGYRFLLANLLYYSGHIQTLETRARAAGAHGYRILRYVRIINPLAQPYPALPEAFVTPEAFYSQMRYLAKQTNVIPLPELLSMLEADRPVPPQTVVITFDGGFRDLYEIAAPVLREFKLPATAFVATAFIDTVNLFWRDKLIAAMLYLEQNGVAFPDIPVLSEALPDSFNSTRSLGRSMARIIYIIRYLENASAVERTATLTYLGSALETIGGLPLERQFLSWDELQRLADQGLSIGLHTHSHRTLEDIREQESTPQQALINEIASARQLLDSHRVKHLPVFGFPEGRITKEGRKTLAELGFRFGLGIGTYARSPASSEHLAILGRIPISQGTSFHAPLFACHLWNIIFGGTRF